MIVRRSPTAADGVGPHPNRLDHAGLTLVGLAEPATLYRPSVLRRPAHEVVGDGVSRAGIDAHSMRLRRAAHGRERHAHVEGTLVQSQRYRGSGDLDGARLGE